MIVNNINRPNIDKFKHAEDIARQNLNTKRMDSIKLDKANKHALEKITSNARIEQACVRQKELDELKLYTSHARRFEYYEYRRILFVGLNFDRYG